MKRFISIIICAAILLAVPACTKQQGGELDTTVQNGSQSAFSSRYSDLDELDSTSVLWSDNFKVSVSMFTYFFNSVYHNYVEAGSYIIDETVSLKEQTYSDGTTWFDYIASETSNNVQIKLFLAEEALANGMTLADSVYEEIDAEITRINNNATAQNISIEANIKYYYGDVVNEATVRKCLELNALAEKYNTEVLDPKYVFDSADYDDCFANDSKSYLAVNYMTYIIPAETGSDEVTAQFAAAANTDEMEALIRQRIALDYPDINEEEYDERINELYVYRQYSSENSAFASWAYDDARQAYDVYTKTYESGITYVAMLLPAEDQTYSPVLYKDMTPVHNVYAIAFLEMDYSYNADDAHSAAESVYEQAKNGADIVSLCNAYSGGSMSNIMYGDAPTAVEEWIFDEARETGEIGLIKVEGVGSYVIQMRADGGAAWQYLCALDMTDEIYETDIMTFYERYPIGTNNGAVENVTEIAGERSIG